MVHLVVGPVRHGVVQHALRVARAGGGRLVQVECADDASPAMAGARMIVHFTDRLFGADAPSAAVSFGQSVAGAEHVTVVLHDLPQASDGASWSRRSAGYQAVSRAADVVVVSSDHEAALLKVLAPELVPRVVPLPVEPDGVEPTAVSGWFAGPTIGVVGFLYPGKGLEQVIESAAGLDVTVVNLGTTAAGHEDAAAQLAGHAAQHDVRFQITGWLSRAELAAACRAVDVPVAAHRHISASGSINTWLGAGRRPIVTSSPYAEEQAARMPGALRVVALADLRSALRDALADPATTWQGADVRVHPTAATVAALLEAAAG